MLFSYALLFAVLTTFVAAAPTSYSKVPTLPATGAPLDAANHVIVNYLTYGSLHGAHGMPIYEPGWTRLLSVQDSANTFGIVFLSDSKHGLSVYFRRISTGGSVSAGLTEQHEPKAVSELNFGISPDNEIVGSWYERETKRKMEIRYDEKEKQFRISPLPEDYAETKKGKKGKKEMTFVKPKGFVPLVGHNCLKTAAGYLAAAGGQWLPNSKSSDSTGLLFDILRMDSLDVLQVQQGGVGFMEPVHVLVEDRTVGRLEGVWLREKRDSSAKQETIQIKFYSDKGLVMEVVE